MRLCAFGSAVFVGIYYLVLSYTLIDGCASMVQMENLHYEYFCYILITDIVNIIENDEIVT